jgi:predicted HicB family RNase H-like nuclease
MVINIRGFPDDLHRQAKIQAAVEGVTLKDLIIKALTEYLKRARKKGR